MFVDIWEPHQTSGFLTAFLCWIYQRITGTTEYLVLYLRICGALIQAAVSIFLYRESEWALSVIICRSPNRNCCTVIWDRKKKIYPMPKTAQTANRIPASLRKDCISGY